MWRSHIHWLEVSVSWDGTKLKKDLYSHMEILDTQREIQKLLARMKNVECHDKEYTLFLLPIFIYWHSVSWCVPGVSSQWDIPGTPPQGPKPWSKNLVNFIHRIFRPECFILASKKPDLLSRWMLVAPPSEKSYYYGLILYQYFQIFPFLSAYIYAIFILLFVG